jgi:hypothetical protein
MKPFMATELHPNADLSQCSLESASDLLTKYLQDSKRSRDNYRGTLHVAVDSEDLIRVIDLARAWTLRLQLQSKYEWDEWSVTWGLEDKDLKLKPHERDFCVWSPGA